MLSENLKPFVAPMLAMARKQFPRECSGCRRRYEDFEQYIRETVPAATTLNYPFDPVGMISWARCACGATISLSCDEMTGEDHRRFTAALDRESKAGGLDREVLMSEIRNEVRRLALSGA